MPLAVHLFTVVISRLPPYSKNSEGRGPAWANSLFEDNAEFGLGFRLTLEQHKKESLVC